MKLPKLPYGGSHMKPTVQTAFGGLEANAGAPEGSIAAMTNLSAREYPLLCPRLPRGLLGTLTAPEGLAAFGAPVWADGTDFYYNGAAAGTVTAGRKRFAAMGTKVLIFPDKSYYDTADGTFGSLEASWSGAGVQFRSGQLYGVPAKSNTLTAAGAAWATRFRAGDAVTISGCAAHPENDRTVIIREIAGDSLYFYEDTFTLDGVWDYVSDESGLPAGQYHFTPEDVTLQFSVPALQEGDRLHWDGTAMTMEIGGSPGTAAVAEGSGGAALTFLRSPRDYTESGVVSLSRDVPDLDFICVNENRLWGCRGSVIYASKLGDPTNFHVFDGLSTDSWASGTVDAGAFTACVSYLGYPVFFKEDAVIKVYGDRPSNFQWTPSARLGVAAGSDRSLAVAGETLFYLSRAGVCAYTGGIPSVISRPLGADVRWRNAVAGSDGLRYYVSMSDGTAGSLFVYDTRCGLWHREDGSAAMDFAWWDGGLTMLADDGKLWRLDGTRGTAETTVRWSCELADGTAGSPNRKGLLRLLLRCELGEGSSLRAEVRYDSAGAWQTLRTLSAAGKRSRVLPLTVRRCDHYRLRLSGEGDARIYSLTEVRYTGSHLPEEQEDA